MKYFLIICLVLVAAYTFADTTCTTQESSIEADRHIEINTDVPKHLKGAQICVFKKESGYNCVPAEKFKIVPRMQQFLYVAVEKHKNTTCQDKNLNRLSVMAGKGPQEGLDVDRSKDPNKVEVSSRFGVVGGVQYQRKVGDKLSLGIQGQTNKSGLMLFGIDF